MSNRIIIPYTKTDNGIMAYNQYTNVEISNFYGLVDDANEFIIPKLRELKVKNDRIKELEGLLCEACDLLIQSAYYGKVEFLDNGKIKEILKGENDE